MSLFIHAINIHSGGGAELLTAILRELPDQERGAVILVDSRFPLSAVSVSFDDLRIILVEPSLSGRLKAEWRLRRLVGPEDRIFSAGNLPPLFQVPAKTTLFLQNRYLVDPLSTRNFAWPTRLRIAFERIWLRMRIGGVERLIVQTASMARLVERSFGRQAEVFPFVAHHPRQSRAADFDSDSPTPAYDFVFVASGEPHKNHARLFEAWEMLAEESIFPSLCVTLDPAAYPALVRLIERVRGKGGIIDNVGLVPREEVAKIYRRSRALIFPSTLESFGLPLLEAKAAGLAILASELDFVRDVAEPEQTFDPASGLSIARAVKRYLGRSEKTPEPGTAGELLRKLADL